MIGRRSLLGFAGFAAAASCGGCGFHAVYGAGGAAQLALPAVYVNLIPNRNGQVLRQALQERLQATDDAQAKRFMLQIGYSETVENVNVQQDNSVTRERSVGVANWTLSPVANSTQRLAGGTVRSVDGYNVVDEQFFYQNLEEEAAQKRLAQALADQIVLGISAYFNAHPDKA